MCFINDYECDVEMENIRSEGNVVVIKFLVLIIIKSSLPCLFVRFKGYKIRCIQSLNGRKIIGVNMTD